MGAGGPLARRARAQAPESMRFPGVRDGLLAMSSGLGRGELSVQGVVDDGVRRGRLDQVVGPGFHFLVDAGLFPALAPASVAALKRAGVRLVVLDTRAYQHDSATVVADVDGTYTRWFAGLGCRGVAVRPDFYVYGTAGEAQAAGHLIYELAEDLGVPAGPAAVLTPAGG
jgi:3-(3-hydroxy-phenyl)propionate hydroxylase